MFFMLNSVPRTEAVATGERTVKPILRSSVFFTFDLREPVSKKSFVSSLSFFSASCSTVIRVIGETVTVEFFILIISSDLKPV